MSTPEKFSKARTERPDKALAGVFFGVFLMIVGVCFGVWSYWTFQDYNHSASYAAYLRRNPDALEPGKYDRNEIISSNENSADRYKIQAIWTASVSLVGLLASILLFIRAFRQHRRLKDIQYEEIDWRAIDKPREPIHVEYSRVSNAAAIVFYLLFGGLTLLLFLTNGLTGRTIVFGLFSFSIIAVIVYLRTNARRKSALLFDASGVTRGDGRHFLWSDLRGVIPRTSVNRFGKTYIWRTELVFADRREAWIIPQRVKNPSEIFELLDKLPRAAIKDAGKRS